MQETYCSMLAQVPPSGRPGKVQPPQATSWPSGACWKWGLLPGLGDPHCSYNRSQEAPHIQAF